MFGRIDHIGVAVEDLDAAIELYEKSFEMALAHRETVEPSRASRRCCSTSARATSSCWRPLGPDTAVGKFLASKGAGLHHVAYAVDDIDATLERLAAAGIELIDTEARVGIRGSRVAFLHPRSTGGVLTEIVEPARRALMADAQKVEIGFEGGQVVSVRLSEDELKDLRKQVEKGGWHDVKTEDGVARPLPRQGRLPAHRLRRAPGRLLSWPAS